MDYDFEKSDAGSALIEKVSAGSLHKGDLVMIKDHPCKITAYTTAKPGKHGAAKAIMTGTDLLTGSKYECTYSTGDTVDAPLVKRTEYNLINLDDDGFCTLLLDSGETKEDIKLPDDDRELSNKITEFFAKGDVEVIVTVLATMGAEKLIGCREGKAQ